MKKIFKIIIPIFLLCIIGLVVFFAFPQNSFDFSTLKLDQKNAYISMSKNDIDGYNRWLPFYFTFSEKSDIDTAQVEAILNEKIENVALYADNKIVYQTNQLIWSAYKVNDELYNLTLVLVPEISDFSFDGLKEITHIELSSDTNSSQKYELSSYMVKQKETLTDELFSVSLSSMESDISEDLIAGANYGIDKNGNKITKFSLEFPKEFSNVTDYKITDTVQSEDDRNTYSVALQLSENSSKSVFRPFLKIEYNNGNSGYLVPSVPVYFR